MLCSHRPLVLDSPRRQKTSNSQFWEIFTSRKGRVLPFLINAKCSTEWEVWCVSTLLQLLKTELLTPKGTEPPVYLLPGALSSSGQSHGLAGRAIRDPCAEAVSCTPANCKRCAFEPKTWLCTRSIQWKFISLPNLLSMRKVVEPGTKVRTRAQSSHLLWVAGMCAKVEKIIPHPQSDS